MIQLSTRYVPHLVVALGLALALTLFQRSSRLRDDACRQPELLLANMSGVVPDGDREKWEEHLARMGNVRWSMRTLSLPDDADPLQMLVLRSWNPTLLYGAPDTYLSAVGRAEKRTIEELAVGDESVPVHRAYFYTADLPRNRTTILAYVLVLGVEPVAHRMRTALLSAPAQLVRGRRPIWLFAVSGEVHRKQAEAAEERMREALGRAWLEYRAACGP